MSMEEDWRTHNEQEEKDVFLSECEGQENNWDVGLWIRAGKVYSTAISIPFERYADKMLISVTKSGSQV